jgi:hypothetical protein
MILTVSDQTRPEDWQASQDHPNKRDKGAILEKSERNREIFPNSAFLILQSRELDAHLIACAAGEKASDHASRTELGIAAYEVAYIEAYADALPALVTTAPAREDVLARLSQLACLHDKLREF